MNPISDATNPMIPHADHTETEAGQVFTLPGDTCPYYEVEGRPYLVMDRDYHGEDCIFIVDVLARRYYTLTWWLDRINATWKKLSCSCELLCYDESGRIEQTCPHYQVWDLYFREFIYEPPEV